jgi:hypothetical protein
MTKYLKTITITGAVLLINYKKREAWAERRLHSPSPPHPIHN